ncbi:hypothetical protein TNIN_398901 [Trichonephila inaurata madagascariensis]|uniref:Uncharacterized protein n=1 Tax=Trichonephila inaurata madagascariensis TaxID=2747483 RepID=A0A8X7C243_9ARAC|nr:hypothetical protein TNIN_398901 [Trichonephila inaurata madagascariensis]
MKVLHRSFRIVEECSNSDESVQYHRPKNSVRKQPPKKSKSWTKVDPDIRQDGIRHYPKKKLKNPPNRHNKKCVRRTRYICEKCEEPVCPECMKSFISLINYH